MAHTDRVVILVDMDCFYCQVEENLDPKLCGKPIAVVQYNAWKGGGIIAVNYPARDRGVTRHMRGHEAQKKCPDIKLVRVPNVRGKADLSKYREAGKRVAEVLQTFTPLLERASVDEAYLDITEAINNHIKLGLKIRPDQFKSTHVVGYSHINSFINYIYDDEYLTESNIKLAWGAVMAEEIREAVYARTGYRCSAGIAHNKILAKLVCGMHKPNQQTVLPQEEIPTLYEGMPVRKIRSLGGKFGNHLSEKLNIQNMGELYQFSEKDLAKCFDEKTAVWLYKIARGIDTEPVTVRLVSKSIGCCKKFPGRTALVDHNSVKHWLEELAEEISERLEKDLEENNRKAKQMVVSFAQEINRKDVASSRVHPLNSYDQKKIMADSYEVIKKYCLRTDDKFRIKFLGLSVGKFEDNKNVNEISSFFKNYAKRNEAVADLPAIHDESKSGYESEDSISGELAVSGCNIPPDTSSFFQTYLKKLHDPVKRDFDTSLVFQAESFDEQLDEILNNEIDSNEQTSTSNSTLKQTPVLETICPECGKAILNTEYVSHMDYHFVLKMVRDEADLYKPKQLDTQDRNKSTSPKKSVKRKAADSGNQKLTSFLVIKTPSGDTETCEECKRHIPVVEYAGHVDYHMAKKLHLELNPIANKENKSDNKGSKVAARKNAKNEKMRSVESYFKPV